MNIELFKDAIAIIAGIPPARLDLRNWQQGVHYDFGTSSRPSSVKHTRQITCGTICCAAGWLALHPQMRAWGLRVGQIGEPVFVRKGFWLFQSEEYRAMADLFQIDIVEATQLFAAGVLTSERRKYKTDKAVWLARAMKLLAKYEAQQNAS